MIKSQTFTNSTLNPTSTFDSLNFSRTPSDNFTSLPNNNFDYTGRPQAPSSYTPPDYVRNPNMRELPFNTQRMREVRESQEDYSNVKPEIEETKPISTDRKSVV